MGETQLALVCLKSLLGSLPPLRGCASDMVGVNKIAEAVTVPRLGKCQPIWPVSLTAGAGEPRGSGCNVARQRGGAGLFVAGGCLCIHGWCRIIHILHPVVLTS